MGILYGYHQPDRGEILVRGRPVAIRSPQDALAAGIGMVHQHFMLVEPFTVLENVVLGVEGGFGSARGWHGPRRAGAAGPRVPPGGRSRCARRRSRRRSAPARGDPEGALPRRRPPDPRRAHRRPDAARRPITSFASSSALRDEGKTVVLVTHKLREIREVTDVVTVMRQGRVVATLPTAETTAEQLAELMVGRTVSLRVDKAPARPGEPVLEVADLVVEDALGVERVKGVSFAVRRGEIVGRGRRGGQRSVGAARGARGHPAGEIRADPLEGPRPRRRGAALAAGMRRLGLAHVPEDRQRMGLVMPFAARESAILGYHDEATYNGAIRLRRSRGGARASSARPPSTTSDRGTARLPHLGLLRRQPAEDRAGPRARPNPGPPPRRASPRAASTSARSSSSTAVSSRCAMPARRSCSCRSSSTRSSPSPTVSS